MHHININKYVINTSNYYIDMSVLPKNGELIFSIRNYIQDTSEIFFISSLVKISLTSFLCFSFVFCLVFFYFWNTHIYVIKKNYTLAWTYEVYLLVEKDFTCSLRSLMNEIFFPLEEKVHTFKPPCNILYVSIWIRKVIYK